MNEHQQTEENHDKSGEPPSFSLMGRTMWELTVNPWKWGVNTCKNNHGKKGGFSELTKVWRSDWHAFFQILLPMPQRICLNEINYCKAWMIYISPTLIVSMRFEKFKFDLGWLPVTPVEKFCSNRLVVEVRCYSLNYHLVVTHSVDASHRPSMDGFRREGVT
jgi:hypothetical protein